MNNFLQILLKKRFSYVNTLFFLNNDLVFIKENIIESDAIVPLNKKQQWLS